MSVSASWNVGLIPIMFCSAFVRVFREFDRRPASNYSSFPTELGASARPLHAELEQTTIARRRRPTQLNSTQLTLLVVGSGRCGEDGEDEQRYDPDGGRHDHVSPISRQSLLHHRQPGYTAGQSLDVRFRRSAYVEGLTAARRPRPLDKCCGLTRSYVAAACFRRFRRVATAVLVGWCSNLEGLGAAALCCTAHRARCQRRAGRPASRSVRFHSAATPAAIERRRTTLYRRKKPR